MNTAEKITDQLERHGPTYEGALRLVVGGTSRTFYRALLDLCRSQVVCRDANEPLIWRLR